MDTAMAVETTIGSQMPWLAMTLDYTERLAALIPEERLDWRPLDPSGRFSFSLGEIAMHCADARRMFARQLAGSESEEGYWSQGPEDNGAWKFRSLGSKQELLDSLQSARQELERFSELPLSHLMEVTPGTQKIFDANIERFRASGKDVSEMQRRGPANIMRVLMAAGIHEAGHRGTLLTLLRQQGINAGDD